MDAPHGTQGTAVVRLLEKKPGKNVRIQLDLGTVCKTPPRLQGAWEKRCRFPPVGLKIGAQVDTGTASAAQSCLDDAVDEFDGSEILHVKTSFIGSIRLGMGSVWRHQGPVLMLHDISRLAYRLPFENGMKGGMKSLRREGSLDDEFFVGHSMFGEYTCKPLA